MKQTVALGEIIDSSEIEHCFYLAKNNQKETIL